MCQAWLGKQNVVLQLKTQFKKAGYHVRSQVLNAAEFECHSSGGGCLCAQADATGLNTASDSRSGGNLRCKVSEAIADLPTWITFLNTKIR